MMSTVEWSPGMRVVAASIAAYIAIVACAASGSMVSSQIPCTGTFCELGRVFQGGTVGIVVALVILVFVGFRLGLRWWFVPAMAAVSGGAVFLASTTSGPAAWACWVVVALAPVIAALLAADVGPRVLGIAVVALVVVVAGTVALLGVSQSLSDRQAAEERAAQFEATAVPLYAPVATPDAEVRLVYARDATVMYDLRTPGHTGWLRILIDTDPAATDRCSWARHDLGDGVSSSDNEDVARMCRSLDGAVAELWPDGAYSGWSRADSFEIARQLAPTDAQWLVSRAN